MKRRQILTTAPLAALTAALTAGDAWAALRALGCHDTPAVALFRKWQALKVQEMAAFRDPSDEGGKRCDELYEERIKLEDRMMALPSQSAACVFAKVMAYTSGGAFALTDGVVPEFWDEACAALGLTQETLAEVRA
ncbi:hypothetical protein [Frigidibacter sp. MR17.24]|uniref:hypothetical protein n=1 Tax=Frigidibacter sp. MR17.24 TaxID=3127345 RepID=UPI0030129FED